MPTWSQILREIQTTQSGNPPTVDFDAVRRKYLVAANHATGRNVILYATKCTQPAANVSPDTISISDEDIQGLMEVVNGLDQDGLDLILHSPGGSLDAVEAVVTYLRSKFDHIRVIVPNYAMSAATMIACAADHVILGKHSFLGPIDPQITITTPLGRRMIPAQAILEQFDQAKQECTDPTKLAAWSPMLSQYGPDLLVQCENASRLARSLVAGWLKQYMFRNDQDGTQKADEIAEWLSTHSNHRSHGRHIPRDEFEAKGFKVSHLEADQNLQDVFLSIFHATTHTFEGTGVVKIIENHRGRAFMKVGIARPQ